MLDFFISQAHAEGGAPAGGGMAQIIMLVGFVLIFYFLLWRPQSKRAKQHKQLINGLSKGDEIVIGGGLVGRVTKVSDEFIAMEIAEGTEVNVQKNAVAAVLPKGTLKSI
ncbi:preprotein translocase subunit YajC [Halomonas sp. McH1-25]|uniref:preprotein translocase subunit YajC n=1 Tax=unclassified Halomonas TaxID=2609666 RepID=UPI001EF3DBCD|nr:MULTISPECIES: preprotein translocase subunit YajC [unclassified Halomonas]MCG7601138.1 preprotein translocase subunit YajC [Halomonas sp. McH1-25]MCP1341828.1 preprotein translocase subunit YajC [Halomonas sp. FL8]MCP1362601.1 preprotein translocase subunit YajC [Halomonas sp. BBD45]MCP1367927.1 preprotein translocase subunit YajC [Halomonas sp. BBD48]